MVTRRLPACVLLAVVAVLLWNVAALAQSMGDFVSALLAQAPPAPAPIPAMSDPVKVALITSTGAVLLGAATLIVSLRNGRLSMQNARQGAETAEKLDGRLTQLLEVTSGVARAIGLADGERIGREAATKEAAEKAAALAAGQAAGLELTGRRPTTAAPDVITAVVTVPVTTPKVPVPATDPKRRAGDA